MKIVKYLSFLLAAACCFWCRAEAVVLTSLDVSEYIEFIGFDYEQKMVVEISKNGGRFSHYEGDGIYRVVKEGQRVPIKNVEPFVLVGRHSGLVLNPLGPKGGDVVFDIIITSDMRSVGGELTTKSAILLVNPIYGRGGFRIESNGDEKNDASAIKNEENNLKGGPVAPSQLDKMSRLELQRVNKTSWVISAFAGILIITLLGWFILGKKKR